LAEGSIVICGKEKLTLKSKANEEFILSKGGKAATKAITAADYKKWFANSDADCKVVSYTIEFKDGQIYKAVTEEQKKLVSIKGGDIVINIA